MVELKAGINCVPYKVGLALRHLEPDTPVAIIPPPLQTDSDRIHNNGILTLTC